MLEEMTSLEDDPEFQATIANLQSQRVLLRASQSYDQRILAALQRCNRRGSSYRPGRRRDPNFTQLAKYCGCNATTILRIATGETKAPSLKTLSIISAITCISPPAYNCDCDEEYYARIADADRWLLGDKTTRGDIKEAILTGIKRRIASRSN